MADLDLLVVGPADRSTGGVARYVDQQRRHLPDGVSVSVYDNGTPADWPLPRNAVVLLATLANVLAFPFRERPDVVHVHSSHGVAFYRAAAYVLLAAFVWRRPVVLHVHGSSFDEFVETASPALRRFQSAVFGASDAVVVLSQYWKDVLAIRVAEEKLHVVPNAVDASDYEPIYDPGVPTVAFVSNHVRRKGIVELADSIAALRDDGAPCFRVRLAGDGPASDHAERLAEQYDAVEYHGYVSEAEKRRLIEESSVYALPTYAEGLPIALLEGMAGGNAVVTTAVGSIPEVVDETNGRLVRPGDVDQLTEALAELVSDPGAVAAMGRSNRRLVEDRYSWSAVSDRLLGVYRSVARVPAAGASPE